PAAGRGGRGPSRATRGRAGPARRRARRTPRRQGACAGASTLVGAGLGGAGLRGAGRATHPQDERGPRGPGAATESTPPLPHRSLLRASRPRLLPAPRLPPHAWLTTERVTAYRRARPGRRASRTCRARPGRAASLTSTGRAPPPACATVHATRPDG